MALRLIAKTPPDAGAAERSRRAKSNSRRGRALEKYIARRIVETFGLDPDDVRVVERGKGEEDLVLSAAGKLVWPYATEAKRRKNMSIPSWLRQAAEQAKKRKLEPVVVFEPPGGITKYAIIRFDHLLALHKERNQ